MNRKMILVRTYESKRFPGRGGGGISSEHPPG